MALSQGPGAELQRPFATVVITGILSATSLTLLLLPLLLPKTAVQGTSAPADADLRPASQRAA
jgi:cobalt-zinc-cadmium resistance protein CzcA